MKPIVCLTILVLASCAQAEHYVVILIAGPSNCRGRGRGPSRQKLE